MRLIMKMAASFSLAICLSLSLLPRTYASECACNESGCIRENKKFLPSECAYPYGYTGDLVEYDCYVKGEGYIAEGCLGKPDLFGTHFVIPTPTPVQDTFVF